MTKKVVATLRFSLEDSKCDHLRCSAEADRFFLYRFSDGDILLAFGCPDHAEPIGPKTELVEEGSPN